MLAVFYQLIMKQYSQNTLFGDKIISTIGFDEQEMIRDILYLHSNGNYIDCDPCYSVGNFYKNGLEKPKHIFDKFPQTKDCKFAESHNLPLENESVNTIMFDPPFVITGDTYGEAKEGSSIIAKRFTGFHDFEEIKKMYSDSLKEFYRILKPNGIVIFKNQDVVACSKNHFTHAWIMNEAIKIGYYPKDLFILLAKARLTDNRKQQHARKYHSYFWVLQKTKNKVNYE